MIKVLIATGIYPPDIGGPTAMVAALADSLRINSISVQVITYADNRSQEGDRVIRIKRSSFKIWSLANYFFNLAKLSLDVDIIYSTDNYSVGYFAYLLKLLTGKKYIIRFAGDSAWETAVNNGWTNDYIVDFQKKKYDNKIEKLKARRTKIMVNADQIIAVSKFLAEVASQIGVQPDKISVIYNSIDFMDQPAAEKVEVIKKKFGNNAKILVTVCRLTPWKGVGGIIKILPKLIDKVGPVNFLVLGDGEELNNLQKIAIAEKIENSVHFLGRVNHNETLAYMSAADLFILNSNYEGLSHVLLEAIKMGTPITASCVGGNPEIINDNQNGLLFKYNNEEDILTVTTKVLIDDDYAEKLVMAANDKLKIFNWSENIKLTVALINKLCHENSTN